MACAGVVEHNFRYHGTPLSLAVEGRLSPESKTDLEMPNPTAACGISDSVGI